MSKKCGLEKVIEIFLNKHNFALVYIALLTIRSVFFLQKYADVGCKVCLLWGLGIIFVDLVKYRKEFFKVNGSYIPLLLCGVYAISVVLNFRYSLYGGIKNLMYCAIYLFLLYAIRREDTKELFYKYLIRNNDVFIVINMLIAVASICTFVFDIKFVHYVDQNQYKVGFWFNRLNGVCNSNMETILGLVSVALCIMNLYLLKGKSRKIKVFYFVNIIFQFIYYAMAGSRAAVLCYYLMLIIWMVFYIFPYFKSNKGILKSAVCVLALIAFVFVGEKFLVNVSQNVMVQAKDLVNEYILVDNMEDEDEINGEDISFERVENYEDGDITNNRSKMWKAAFKIVKQYPVFGVAYADQFDADGTLKDNLDASVFDEADLVGLKTAGFYFHNGFVQILLCGGISFFIVFLLLVLKQVYKYMRYILVDERNKDDYKTVLVIFMLIAALFVDNMVEVHLLFSGQDGVAAILWYLLGCGVFLIEKHDGAK